MRLRAWAAGLASLSFALGACGDGDDGAALRSPAELGAALLTADDLGTGWAETQRDVFTTRKPENPSIDPSLWCPQAASQTSGLAPLAGDTGADVEIENTSATLPAEAFHGVRQQAWSNHEASAYFDAVGAALATCAGATWTGEDGSLYTMEPLPGPPVGDESGGVRIVIRMPADGSTMVWQSRETVARFGSTVMVLQEGDVQGADATPVMTDAEYQELVDRAAVKMAAIHDG